MLEQMIVQKSALEKECEEYLAPILDDLKDFDVNDADKRPEFLNKFTDFDDAKKEASIIWLCKNKQITPTIDDEKDYTKAMLLETPILEWFKAMTEDSLKRFAEHLKYATTEYCTLTTYVMLQSAIRIASDICYSDSDVLLKLLHDVDIGGDVAKYKAKLNEPRRLKAKLERAQGDFDSFTRISVIPFTLVNIFASHGASILVLNAAKSATSFVLPSIAKSLEPTPAAAVALYAINFALCAYVQSQIHATCLKADKKIYPRL